MRYIDTFTRTRILENANNLHKMAYLTNFGTIAVPCVFLRILEKLSNITEYVLKIL